MHQCISEIFRFVGLRRQGYLERPLGVPRRERGRFLTYPGVRYGIDAPLGTIRLDAVRDAQEDYEYLWLLERLVSEANEKYGTEIAGEALLRDLYDSLYSGSIAVTDPYAVLNAREEVARMMRSPGKVVAGNIEVSRTRRATECLACAWRRRPPRRLK